MVGCILLEFARTTTETGDCPNWKLSGLETVRTGAANTDPAVDNFHPIMFTMFASSYILFQSDNATTPLCAADMKMISLTIVRYPDSSLAQAFA